MEPADSCCREHQLEQLDLAVLELQHYGIVSFHREHELERACIERKRQFRQQRWLPRRLRALGVFLAIGFAEGQGEPWFYAPKKLLGHFSPVDG
jgi:hypothetical protein